MADTDVTPVPSRWWLGVAVMPVVTLVELFLGTMLVGAIGSTSNFANPLMLLAPAAPFVVVAFVVRLLLPVALFKDGSAIRASGNGWEPTPNWAFAGLVGIFLPLFDSAVATYYLYRRHVALGTP